MRRPERAERQRELRIVRRTCKYRELNRFQQISNVGQFHRGYADPVYQEP